MKRFCVFACLCLICVVLMADTALAGDVSSTAISLDLAAGSIEIYESEGVTYCVQNEVTQATTGGVVLQQSNNTVATNNEIKVVSGTTKLTIFGLNIYDGTIAIGEGAALDLTLLGDNTIQGRLYDPGISVPADASLTINGSGIITATGGKHGAGIGSGNGDDCGTVIINSGIITARGGHSVNPNDPYDIDYGCAGIGGGWGGNGGNVIINGGTVIAEGQRGESATGGGGSDIGPGGKRKGGSLTINGGNITLERVGVIGSTTTINGGTVNARLIESEDIVINGGDITTSEYIKGKSVAIYDGIIHATGRSYEAIACSSGSIYGGTIIATGGANGAGIGGGKNNYSHVSITINGGIITATGGTYGAGIGGGKDDYSHVSITINGGTITATGGTYGAGIGGGYNGTHCSVDITGGTVIVNGGTGGTDVPGDIGAGSLGTAEEVSISNEAFVTDEKGNSPRVEETIFISGHPQLSAALVGSTPAMSVTANGYSGLSYQWQISADNTNWDDLENETASTTASFAMANEHDGNYVRCKLTNGWGNVEYSNSAPIYILAFAQQPHSVEATINELIYFEASSTCSNVIYQWQRSYDDGETWSDIFNEVNPTLLLNATLSVSNTRYRCVITATNGDQLASDVVSVNLDLGDLVTYTVQDFWQNVDGSGYTVTSQQVLEGLSGTVVTAPTEGYDGFVLNDRKSSLSGTVAEDSSLMLTRYFDRNTYSISFDTNGGSALPDLDALYGASITAPGVPTRYGQFFDGWYADESLTEEYIFDTMPLGGATVYAKWAPVGADRGIEYTVNGLSLRDSTTFELLDAIPKDNFLVEVSVTNLEATETDTILLVYYTDEGQMLGMNYMFANTPVGYTATFGASVDNNNGNIGIIRAFVLPSLGNPIPLANSAEIK